MQEEGGKPELCNRTFSVNSAYGRVELLQKQGLWTGKVVFLNVYLYSSDGSACIYCKFRDYNNFMFLGC